MDPFLGEIKLLPWNWAPRGWALCNGAILPITQFTALFSLLGTQYGGNGQTNFALPDLRGRVAIYFGSTYSQGELDGTENVTLTLAEMPSHNHQLLGYTQPGTAAIPDAALLSNVGGNKTPAHYAGDATTISLNPAAVQATGGNQSHNNMQPYLVLNYCIATTGTFPSRN